MNDFFTSLTASGPLYTILFILAALVVILVIARNIIARWIIAFSKRTETRVDDMLVKHIKPMRAAWLAPMIALYLIAEQIPAYQYFLEIGALFGILWLGTITISSLLNAINEIYESRPNYKGVSIQGYLEIVRILLFLVAIILSVSLFSGESPVVLLTGLGALTAVLLLVFQNTILSLVASVQINSMDLINEGDWIEVPEFGADGDVVDISLHTIKVQNFDMTFAVIPTHKIMETAYRNWRGMEEAGGRRIERSILIDMTSIQFCNEEMLDRLSRIDLICEYVSERMKMIRDHKVKHASDYDSPLDGPQVTNTEIFRRYIEAYLHNRDDIHHDKLPFLVRNLEPTQTGLPIELYLFTKTTVWEEYEAIQSEIFDHLLAAANHFDLHVFQEPTGMDFRLMNSNRLSPEVVKSL
jgi:miniconductance mechanosensitive channel